MRSHLSAAGRSLEVTAGLALVVLGACTAEIGAPPVPDPGGSMPEPGPGTPTPPPPTMPMPMPPEADPGPPCVATQKAFAPARLWQLTDAQYVNVVHDVFGITLAGIDAEIVSAGTGDQYSNYSEGVSIGAQAAPNYQTAAVKVATQAVGKMAALLGASPPTAAQVQGFISTRVARVYGIAGVVGNTMTPVTVPGTQRGAGILTQPGLLVAANKWAERADPIHRGLMVYDAFVCGAQIPPPPADAANVASTMSGTEREKAAMRAAQPACSPCHGNFDPLGLSFERYDAIGRYNETRQAVLDSTTGMTTLQTTSAPIDSSAVLSPGLGPDLAGPIADVNALAAKLRDDSVRVGYCATRRLAEYSLGHNPDAENSCELKAVKMAFIKAGSFKEFFRALALSPGFRTRDPLEN